MTSVSEAYLPPIQTYSITWPLSSADVVGLSRTCTVLILFSRTWQQASRDRRGPRETDPENLLFVANEPAASRLRIDARFDAGRDGGAGGDDRGAAQSTSHQTTPRVRRARCICLWTGTTCPDCYGCLTFQRQISRHPKDHRRPCLDRLYSY